MLAFACRRSGKVRDEGRSYYSIGVLYDNIKKNKKAVEYYLKFLQVCKSINDSHGEALAYNCIGVDYQLLGERDIDFIPKAI
jgi:tetratricopeptide (TPR) repeat protein